MKFNYSSKFSKFSKINKSNPITNSEKPKINKYDVLFDLNHLENLMKQPVYYQVVPEYINKFFFKYGDDIFYDNGETFERVGNGPVLGPSLNEPFLVGDGFVKKYNNQYFMFYLFMWF